MKENVFNFRVYGREGHRCALSFKPSVEWTDWDGHRFVLHANDELACGYQYADMDVYASDILSAIDLLRAQLEDGTRFARYNAFRVIALITCLKNYFKQVNESNSFHRRKK